MTKGGIHAFTRSLSGSLMERGIRVNAVAPGPVWTPRSCWPRLRDGRSAWCAARPAKASRVSSNATALNLFRPSSWRAARLQVPRKRPRKRVAAARSRPQAPCGPNQVWSYDFVFDRCAKGQQLKTVTDEFTKEGLAIDVDGRIRSPRVIDVLSRLVSARGAPAFLRSETGRSSYPRPCCPGSSPKASARR
jgi:transposase InsO family protein